MRHLRVTRGAVAAPSLDRGLAVRPAGERRRRGASVVTVTRAILAASSAPVCRRSIYNCVSEDR